MQKTSEITQDVFFTGNLQGPRKNGFNRHTHGDVHQEHVSPLAADAHKAKSPAEHEETPGPLHPPCSLLQQENPKLQSRKS